ncbi:MAG: DEAD/DEAH box helicase family protein, partial [Acetobacteraceae bacterium]|nr:DEAD/DEAH box helicase family protein [Acetobacteraceae bacterium]
MVLRPYQEGAIDNIRAAYQSGARAPLLVLPTGGGKTIIFAHATMLASARGTRTLVVAHRIELIRQASAKLTAAGVQHGIIAPGFPATNDVVQVGSIQTLARRLDRLREFDLIIIDEAHHAVAGQWA